MKLTRAKNAEVYLQSSICLDGMVLKYRQLYSYGHHYSAMNNSYLYVFLAEFQVEKVQVPVIIFQIL
jgi:hypothetical protein